MFFYNIGYAQVKIILTVVSECIVMKKFYFSFKQVNHDYSLPRTYAVICGRFNITVI